MNTGNEVLGMIAPNDKVLTVRDVAKIMNITEAAVRKQIHDKKIPARKRGKKWIFLFSEIYQLLYDDGYFTEEFAA